ncbi:MAG: acyl carrier protein, partial [Armatimonadetes bacterium]|nr:acyl carrier protein [Armatimonadota bacterium]
LAEILEVDEVEVNADLNLTELETWDSLAVVSAIVAIQQIYGVNLEAAALADCETVGDVLKAMEAGKQ